MQCRSQRHVANDLRQFYMTFFAWHHTLRCCIKRNANTGNTSSSTLIAKKYYTSSVRSNDALQYIRRFGCSTLHRNPNFNITKRSASAVRKISTQKDAKDTPPTIQSSPDIMRSLMSRISHPIAIVTSQFFGHVKLDSAYEENSQKYSRLCAMTVSSISTVSLEPDQVISFNIRRPSRTHDAIFQSGEFYVQFLTASVAGRFIGEAFSRGDAVKGFEMLDEVGIFWSRPSAMAGGPQITGNGVLASMRCQLLAEKCIEVGDHAVIIAIIDSISPGSEQMDGGKRIFSGSYGLTYAMRDYRDLGKPITQTFSDDLHM